MAKHRIFTMEFSKVYPLYVQKAERKNRTKAEVDRIICWLTGYDQAGLEKQIGRHSDFETFFDQAPAMHPNTSLINGVVCGVRVEDVQDPMMRKIRYLDKLIETANLYTQANSAWEAAVLPLNYTRTCCACITPPAFLPELHPQRES